MIELYHLENLKKCYAKVPINSGNTRGARNGYYMLSFSILNSYLKQRKITINHNTIFKTNGLYYVSTSSGNSDTTQIERSITAELLQTQVLMFKYIDELTLKNTTLSEAVSSLLKDTIFEVGNCDDIGTFDFEILKNNAQYGLAELIKQTDTEVSYEGLTISLKQTQWDQSPTIIKKGYDFTTLDESTDIGDVITRLHFKNTKGDLTGTVDSEYIHQYNFIRESYQEFDAEEMGVLTRLATEYLQTIDKPRASISISIPKVRKLDLKLCQVVRLHNTLLDAQMDYKVIGCTKSLTEDANTYELGERKKDFSDISQLVTQEVEEAVQNVAPTMIVEVIEHEVITAKTAHILNAWITDLNVEYLETNFEILNARNGIGLGNLRNFIRIKKEQIDFVTQSLSDTEVEDYKNRNGEQIYYTAIKDHPQAYRFFTLTHPKLIYPDLTDQQVEEFKVKTRKVLTESVKASFKFDVSETNTWFPMMVWGAGTDVTGSEKGRGYLYKDTSGMVLKYITSTGKEHQIKLGEKGIEGINLPDFGLIEIPGEALTEATFYSDGMELHHGKLTSKFSWNTDNEGRITELYNHKTKTNIPVNWDSVPMPE